MAGMSVRLMRFCSAERRSGRKPISSDVSCSSSANWAQEHENSSDTRFRMPSSATPASAQMTIRSSASGRPLRMADTALADRILHEEIGTDEAEHHGAGRDDQDARAATIRTH